MLTTLQEGRVTLRAYTARVPSEAMPVFYNPRMRINRDLSVLTIRFLLDEWYERGVRHLRLAFPLAASGVRVKRILIENRAYWERILERNVYAEVILTDINPEAIRLARENLDDPLIRALEEKGLRIRFETRDANESLLANREYDYISIDPYGSPNPFLAAAFLTAKHRAIIEITQTDTAPLTGSAPRAALRKYHAHIPFQPRYKHFLAIMLLAAHLERVASMYEHAARILLSFHEEHYTKIILRVWKNPAEASQRIAAQRKASICPSCHTLTMTRHETCSVCEARVEEVGLLSTQIGDSAFITRLLAMADAYLLSPHARRELERVAQLPRRIESVIDTHQLSKRVKKGTTISRSALQHCLEENAIRTFITPFHPTSLVLIGNRVGEHVKACSRTS